MNEQSSVAGALLYGADNLITCKNACFLDVSMQGRGASWGLILDMVSENMLSNPSSRGFLIDGFPRELKQAKEFERIILAEAPENIFAKCCSVIESLQ